MSLSVEDQKKLIEAQITISESLKGINQTLEKINDQNILHNSQTSADHKSFMDILTTMTAKYWWIIVLLVVALIVLAGAEKAFKFWS